MEAAILAAHKPVAKPHEGQRVIVKSETSRRGFSTRYVEQQFLFSDRTSCHEWWPNQYRLLLSGLAYLLLERLRRIYLKRTAFASHTGPSADTNVAAGGALADHARYRAARAKVVALRRLEADRVQVAGRLGLGGES